MSGGRRFGSDAVTAPGSGCHVRVRRLRAHDAVTALHLRAIDGEVGVVDELVRVGAVAREGGDAHRDGGLDRLGRRLDLVAARGDRGAHALGDLHRLLERRLREQDGELLPAEARRDVVVAQLGLEDLGDAAEDGVAGEVAVRVVDFAQQVEVGHDQRQRPVEALRARELLRQRRCEVARVEEARLRVDAGVLLKARDVQRAVDERQRRERHRHEPRVPVPELREADAE
jgi:hypothetical protein